MRIVLFALLLIAQSTYAGENDLSAISNGMSKASFLQIHPKSNVRSYRQSEQDEWLSFQLKPDSQNIYTFHFSKNKLIEWKINDRPEIIEEYLGEFCSLQGFPIIFTAIKNVLQKMPYEEFLKVTDRRRPVIFVEFYDSGTARFASSQEFIVSKNDPPCCQEGFTLLKLGLSLGLAKTPEPMEGVIAHELAHRVLDHIRNGHVNCQAEREANALIKKWGFSQEFKEASRIFGHRKNDPVGCKE